MLRLIPATLALATLACLGAQPALADPVSAANDGGVHWHLAAGYSAPQGAISDYLQGGYVISGGFTVSDAGNPLALRGDFSLSGHDATRAFLAYGSDVSGVQVDSGAGRFASFSLGPKLSVPLGGPANAYVFVQAGVYRTSLQLAQTSELSGGVCERYIGICGNLFPGESLAYDDTRTRFGWNYGVGFEIVPRVGPAYFVEASYHRISGPQPVDFVPIEAGIRF